MEVPFFYRIAVFGNPFPYFVFHVVRAQRDDGSGVAANHRDVGREVNRFELYHVIMAVFE